MKKAFIMLLALSMTAAACKKSDDAGTGGKIAGGSFSINNVSYDVTSEVRTVTNNMVWFSFWNFNMQTLATATVNFYFAGTATPASGTYNVVTSSAGLGATDMYFQASVGDGSGHTTTYYPVADDGTATVTVNDGKVTIVMGSVSMSSSAGGSANTTASASVGEK
jgi:hypothetical protein